MPVINKEYFDVICVIPYFNEEKYIENFLKQIKSQKLNLISVLVIFVDNNSADRTITLIENYCRTKGIKYKIIFEKKQGIVYARTTGLRYAISEYNSRILLTTDVDVSFGSKLILQTYRDFDSQNADVVGGQFKKDPRTDLFNRLASPKLFNFKRSYRNLEYKIFGPYFFGGFFAIKSEFFANLINYDPEKHKKYMGEDISLSKRCYYMGAKIITSSEIAKPSPRKDIFYRNEILGVNIGNKSQPHVDKVVRYTKIGDSGFINKNKKRESLYIDKLLKFSTKRFLWLLTDVIKFNNMTLSKYGNVAKVIRKAEEFIGINSNIFSGISGNINQSKLFGKLNSELYETVRERIKEYVAK